MSSFDHIRPIVSITGENKRSGNPYLRPLKFGDAWVRDLECVNELFSVPYGISPSVIRKKTGYRWILTFASEIYGEVEFKGPDMGRALDRAIRALETRVLSERKRIHQAYKASVHSEVGSPKDVGRFFRGRMDAKDTVLIGGHPFPAKAEQLNNGQTVLLPCGVVRRHAGFVVKYNPLVFGMRTFNYPHQGMAYADAMAEFAVRVEMVDAVLKRRTKELGPVSADTPFGLANTKFTARSISAGYLLYVRTGISNVQGIEVSIAIRITDPLFKNRVADALRFISALNTWIDKRLSENDIEAITRVTQCNIPKEVLDAIDGTKISKVVIDSAVRYIVDNIGANRRRKRLAVNRNAGAASLKRVRASIAA